MKKILSMALATFSLLLAQNPLYISKVTFAPKGCSTAPVPATSDISATGAGGSPTAEGYTFTLSGPGITTPLTQIGKTVTFTNVGVLTGTQQLTLTIQDSTASTAVSYQLFFGQSQSESVTFHIDSLPLEDQPGCITLSVTKPGGGNPASFVSFGVSPLSGPRVVHPIESPFRQTFSSHAQAGQLVADILISNDCAVSGTAWSVTFPFPQGQGNTVKKFIYKKYCSCTLSPDTIPVLTTA